MVARYNIFYVFIFIVSLVSCKKFLDVGNPPDKVVAQFVYSSNSSAAAVLTGIYFDLQKEGDGFTQGRSGLSLYCGLAADEYETLPISAFNDMYKNALPYDFWSTIYKYVYRINAALEGLDASSIISSDVKSQLLGEAYFLRAFVYFYLVNLYGDVPLLLSSDYKINSQAKRDDVITVYKQIVADLLRAEDLLSDRYLEADARSESSDRIRPNKWVAKALLARAYLYSGNWKDAEAKSGEVIDNKFYYDTVSLDKVFTKQSKEAIWQLQPMSDGVRKNTIEAEMFVLVNNKPDDYFNPVWLSSFLDQSFEDGDQRHEKWVGKALDTTTGKLYKYFYKYKKYKIDDQYEENLMVMRIVEQYLIRAEARAQLAKFQDAIEDLNLVRRRVGLKEVEFSSKDSLVECILHEKQIELFAEWGHRWFDLKRVRKIDQVMRVVAPVKGGAWSPYMQLFPLPLNDLRYNVNLKQNVGYPSN